MKSPMDYTELYNAAILNILTDLTLHIVDTTKEITVDLHKIILYANSKYFMKLLTMCREKDMKEITIEVYDANVFYDIIMSFYGQDTNIGDYAKWKHILFKCICNDFLAIENDTKDFPLLEVPPEDFATFIEIILSMRIDKNIVQLVIRNLARKFNKSCSRLKIEDYQEIIVDQELIKMIDEECKNTFQYIISGSNDGKICKWDFSTGELKYTIRDDISIFTIGISHKNNIIVSAGDGQYIKIWDLESGDLINMFDNVVRKISFVGFSHDETLLASADYNCKVKIWNVVSGILEKTLDCTATIFSLVFTSDDSTVITAGSDRQINFWHLPTTTLLDTFACDNTIYSISLSPNSKFIAAGGVNMVINIYDIELHNIVAHLIGHTDEVNCLCYTTDGTKIISCSDDLSIKIWDANAYTLINTLYGHTKMIRNIVLTFDDEYIVSVSSDKSIKIWDVSKGVLLREINGHILGILSVSVS